MFLHQRASQKLLIKIKHANKFNLKIFSGALEVFIICTISLSQLDDIQCVSRTRLCRGVHSSDSVCVRLLHYV